MDMCGGGRVGVWLGGRSGARSSGEPERTVPRASAVGVASLSGRSGLYVKLVQFFESISQSVYTPPRVGALAPKNERKASRQGHTPTRDSDTEVRAEAARTHGTEFTRDRRCPARRGARRTPETPQKQNSNILSVSPVYVQCTASYTSTHMLPRDLTDTSPS